MQTSMTSSPVILPFSIFCCSSFVFVVPFSRTSFRFLLVLFFDLDLSPNSSFATVLGFEVLLDRALDPNTLSINSTGVLNWQSDDATCARFLQLASKLNLGMSCNFRRYLFRVVVG